MKLVLCSSFIILIDEGLWLLFCSDFMFINWPLTQALPLCNVVILYFILEVETQILVSHCVGKQQHQKTLES